jgi:hypothetical protein
MQRRAWLLGSALNYATTKKTSALLSVSVQGSATTAARVMVSNMANAFYSIAPAATNKG